MQVIRAEERVAVELNVNGQRERVYVEPSRLLCDVLREDLGLTGLKVACGAANCGACTVLVADEPHRNTEPDAGTESSEVRVVRGTPIYSCITLALDCEGCAITTIEGLARGNELHPVQRAFIQYDALQCGFCTSGQILTMSAFLEKNAAPSEEELRQAMAGNLCRCGAYVKLLEAGKNVKRET